MHIFFKQRDIEDLEDIFGKLSQKSIRGQSMESVSLSSSSVSDQPFESHSDRQESSRTIKIIEEYKYDEYSVNDMNRDSKRFEPIAIIDEEL